MTAFTALSFLSSPRTSMSQESELMKSEMQIMTAQLGSTAAADENPRPNKGEKNGSIFIFTRMPPRDKRIFTSSARKLFSNVHFPRYSAIDVRMHGNDNVFFLKSFSPLLLFSRICIIQRIIFTDSEFFFRFFQQLLNKFFCIVLSKI